MIAQVNADQYGSPSDHLYDPGVAKTERMGVETVRKVLGQRLDTAREQGVHTIIAKHGADAGVLVPMDWYRQAREAIGDPTDL